ncbi:MAG: FkbM family methyltransferase [Candidatus Paceibacterota bacterium]
MINILKKIKPYLFAQLTILKRKIYEWWGDEKFSKPYLGHDKLLKYINKKGGFFVVGGGNDGYFQDPTYYLERFLGWTGIIIEPTRASRYCQINRPRSIIVKKALVSCDFLKPVLTLIDCNAMTIVKDDSFDYLDWVRAGEKAQKITAREITVPTSTLDSLLDEYFLSHKMRTIDLLTLDIEGYELEALRGLSFRKYKPNFLLIEIHSEKRQKKIGSFLDYNYQLITIINGVDYLYQAKEATQP